MGNQKKEDAASREKDWISEPWLEGRQIGHGLFLRGMKEKMRRVYVSVSAIFDFLSSVQEQRSMNKGQGGKEKRKSRFNTSPFCCLFIVREEKEEGKEAHRLRFAPGYVQKRKIEESRPTCAMLGDTQAQVCMILDTYG